MLPRLVLTFKEQVSFNFRAAVTICSDFAAAAAAAAKSLQSCPTLCDPVDGSPSGSPVPGILQARTLEWVAISFSNANLDSILKSRHYLVNKGPSSQGYGLSSGHIWM